MNITYRMATPSDVELLVNARLNLLEEDSGKMSDNEREHLYQSNKKCMEAGISNGSFFAFLAFDGNIFVGTCSVCLYSVLPGRKLPNGKNAYIQNMFVAPSYRRNGIGRTLVSLCVNEAAKLHHNMITLHATQNGQMLFAQCGFKTPDNERLTLMVYT
jgi:GNAT superfamily N-acetyltransferase